jgi:hypothetical protein
MKFSRKRHRAAVAATDRDNLPLLPLPAEKSSPNYGTARVSIGGDRVTVRIRGGGILFPLMHSVYRLVTEFQRLSEHLRETGKVTGRRIREILSSRRSPATRLRSYAALRWLYGSWSPVTLPVRSAVRSIRVIGTSDRGW